MLKVAIQMDPIEAINIEADTTFLMAWTAQERGHRCGSTRPDTLALEDGRLFCRARPVTLRQTVRATTSTFGDWVKLDLAEDIDVILMRQDPPFDMAYVTATYLLETVHPQDPGGERPGRGAQRARRSCSSPVPRAAAADPDHLGPGGPGRLPRSATATWCSSPCTAAAARAWCG